MGSLSGYVLEIYHKGKIKESVNGYREIYPQKNKMNSNTYFDIASLTKTYTATLIYICYEEKLISLKDKISNIEEKFLNLKDITILDLLTHNQEIWTNGYLGDILSVDEFYNVLYSAYVKNDIPKYTDTHYIILGVLLEKIYNKPLEKIIQEKIFDKLQLKNTKFKVEENVASTNYENFIDSGLKNGEVHDTKARALFYIDKVAGHASIFCTAGDLIKFLKSFFDYSLLKEETIREMLNHEDINKYNRENNTECKTHNYMGARYYNEIKSLNDVPNDGNIISFSGYTGPRYLIDFDNKIIIVLMCSSLHYNKMNRKERFNTTKDFVYNEYYKLIKEL